MLKTSAPDKAVIEWLWSDEGIEWHRLSYRMVGHQYGHFAQVKDDHECKGLCSAGVDSGIYDQVIKRELENYGESGVPDFWYREWLDAKNTSGGTND